MRLDPRVHRLFNALRGDRLDDATRLGDALLADAPDGPTRAWALLGLAAARTREGRFDDALRLYHAIDPRHLDDERRTSLPTWIGATHALEGDLAAAERCLAAAPAASRTWLEAIVLARGERWDELDRVLTLRWDGLRLEARDARTLRILWAWALSGRRPGHATRLLAELGPDGARDLGYLHVAWPELRAFLSSRNLV